MSLYSKIQPSKPLSSDVLHLTVERAATISFALHNLCLNFYELHSLSFLVFWAKLCSSSYLDKWVSNIIDTACTIFFVMQNCPNLRGHLKSQNIVPFNIHSYVTSVFIILKIFQKIENLKYIWIRVKVGTATFLPRQPGNYKDLTFRIWSV